mgnify:CR=1 FL=1
MSLAATRFETGRAMLMAGLRQVHPFMQALIRACGFPLAAPSANLANRLSPTNVSHVLRQLGDQLSLVVDGGDCNVGIESTVVDATGDAAVGRPGHQVHQPE